MRTRIVGAHPVTIDRIEADGTRTPERTVNSACCDCFWRVPHECDEPLRIEIPDRQGDGL